jgi:hypothetical protein
LRFFYNFNPVFRPIRLFLRKKTGTRDERLLYTKIFIADLILSASPSSNQAQESTPGLGAGRAKESPRARLADETPVIVTKLLSEADKLGVECDVREKYVLKLACIR